MEYLSFLALAILILAVGLYFWLGRWTGKGKKPRWAVVIIVANIGLIMTIAGAANLNREIASGRWPMIEGKIILSEVVGDRAFHPEITYVYYVSGNEYSHTSTLKTPGFGGKRNRLELAEYLVAEYPAGTSIPVYYNPDNPAVSELKTGITYRTCLETALGVILLCGAVIMAIPLFGKSDKS